MTHAFRIRVNLSKASGIEAAENRIDVPSESADHQLTLSNPDADRPLREATRLVLGGKGFKTTADAEENGKRCLHAFLFALAKHRVGVDFAPKGPLGVVTNQGLGWYVAQYKKRYENDHHGLMVYETEPAPQFLSMSAEMKVLSPVYSVVQAIRAAIDSKISFSDREMLSLALFNGSLFQPDADGRFITLMMAIEALLEPIERSPEARGVVANFLTCVKDSELSSEEKSSMIGSLNWLMMESITKTGQRLAEKRLPGRSYNGIVPSKFFSRCYGIRSKLVHGDAPLTGLTAIEENVATLEVFVADLLTVDKLKVS